MLKRVGPAIAGLVVVAALAVARADRRPAIPRSARAPPRGRPPTAATRRICPGRGPRSPSARAASVTSRYDDSDAKLTREGESATAGLRLIASRAKHGPVRRRRRLQLRPRVRGRLRVPGQLRGRHDLGRPRPEQPDGRRADPVPGLAERRHDQRRDPDHLDGLAPHRRRLQQLERPEPDGGQPGPAGRVGGPEDLGRRGPDRPAKPGSATVQTDCGSHTHTVLPEANRLLVYVQSYDVGAGRTRLRHRGRRQVARQDLGRRGPRRTIPARRR